MSTLKQVPGVQHAIHPSQSSVKAGISAFLNTFSPKTCVTTMFP